jgi:hypothetical protein
MCRDQLSADDHANARLARAHVPAGDDSVEMKLGVGGKRDGTGDVVLLKRPREAVARPNPAVPVSGRIAPATGVAIHGRRHGLGKGDGAQRNPPNNWSTDAPTN